MKENPMNDIPIIRQIVNTELTGNMLALWYLGQEGFLMKYGGKYVLIDPYLTDYVDKYCGSDKVTWRRRYAPPVHAEMLGFIDYVVCSHIHFDHADPDTLSAIAKHGANTKFIIPAPCVHDICAYGIDASRIIGAEADNEMPLDNISILPIPAAHEQLHTDAQGRYNALGYLFKLGGITVFHAGDSCPYDGLETRISGINIAMLPINGRDYFRLNNGIIGNMTIDEAVTLAENAGADLIIPMHFDLYEANCANPAHFVESVYSRPNPLSFHIFRPGERFIYGV